ncbi:hypothetical protein N7491_006035 [Penicillium cf. griseofulvum]|uniref:AB hydrolase-1 domain-containing protein n=1 Tax=Penicillium cf. griseofulvum TaxID=2972120 RepID=A0A9W9IXZ2_9EURO|nr:hypothetical protein N7472_010934 [Penicillium cf. griseofulvum]KAJ5429019.1 hypothetical protein N7491_006035 [Penicillium cf. griseofulvum]KAJ5437190.1 hypothetical protein N7445_008075 [Penicillium cf. griseofulvum]
MTMAENPVFVFVPGAWHAADTFDVVRDLMHRRGFATKAISTPSVGACPPDKGLHADIEHTHAVLKEMVEAGRQVVVVNHSYGGIVGAGAVQGLGYAQRCKAGLPGGVIMVVWLAAFVTPKGKTVMDMLGGNLAPWMIVKSPEDGYCWSSQQDTVFYNDMSPEEQQKAISKLKPHALKAFHEPATHEPWHEMPSMYMFCDQDAALPLHAQESFAETLGNPVTYHVDASHSAFLSVPDKVIDGLEVALKEGQQQSGIAVN